MRIHRAFVLTVAAALALGAAACGGDDDATGRDDDGGAAATRPTGVLSGVCPDPVIVQADWYPEAEHGATYALLGDAYDVDAAAKRVRGPLVASGRDTGVMLEIRAGGPAIGNQPVTSLLYQDPSVLLGYVNLDEALLHANERPTVLVVAPLEKNPQIIMWDPQTYPEADTIAELPDDVPVLVFEGGVNTQWLVANGVLDEDQIEPGYDGTPARFVAEGGRVAQQGFASAEPYLYEHEFEDWGRPVAYQLIHDTGLESYVQAMAARPEVVDAERDCLERLVPIIQQAVVDYERDPDPVNARIVDIVEAYDDFWQYSPGVAAYSIETQRRLGLIGNGDDDTVGNFDLDRVQGVIDALVPIFDEIGTPIDPVPDARALVTNEFIDPAIGLDG